MSMNRLGLCSTPMAVPIDHNVREREMKRVVLNRKKLLVREQPGGGRTAAILASLTKRLRRGPTNKKPAGFRASQRASTGAFLEARLHADDFDITPFAAAVSDR